MRLLFALLVLALTACASSPAAAVEPETPRYSVALTPEQAAACDEQGGCRFMSFQRFLQAVDAQTKRNFADGAPLDCGRIVSAPTTKVQ